MLKYIKIQNYIYIKNFEGYLNKGFTTITGETGAGKSMILSAIDLACGKKINFDTSKSIGKTPADITLAFDISNNEKIKEFLKERDLYFDDSLIIRRVIHQDGKNNGYINNAVVPLKDLAYVSSHLIEIHSQDSTRNILNEKNQIRAIDDFVGNSKDYIELKYLSRKYYELKEKLRLALDKNEADRSKMLLLEYKYNELKSLDVGQFEYQEIFSKFKDFSNAKEYIDECREAIEIMDSDDVGLNALLSRIYKCISHLNIEKDNVKSLISMYNDSISILAEMRRGLEDELDSYDMDEDEYYRIEKRIAEIDSFAKKNNISSEDVFNYAQDIFDEYEKNDYSEINIDDLKDEIEKIKSMWYETAKVVSEKRLSGVDSFKANMEGILSSLKMQDSKIDISFKDVSHEVNEFGLEKPKLLIKTNIGQSFSDLADTLSGGEASRFSLALQSILKEKNKTIIFDEIDTGINGQTANAVGKYMLEISKNSQVLSITHIHQVAMFSDFHFVVKKNPKYSDEITNIIIEEINDSEFIHELARMMGHEIIDINIKNQIKAMRSERRANDS